MVERPKHAMSSQKSIIMIIVMNTSVSQSVPIILLATKLTSLVFLAIIVIRCLEFVSLFHHVEHHLVNEIDIHFAI